MPVWPSKATFSVLGKKGPAPFLRACGKVRSMRCHNRSRSCARRAWEGNAPLFDMLSVRAKATAPKAFSVPPRRPFCWPQPYTNGMTRAPRRMYCKPTPLGPYSLCAPTDNRSIVERDKSKSSLPNAHTQSQWYSTPCARHSAPSSSYGCTTPVSLFAPITDTRKVFGRNAWATSATCTTPSLRGARRVTG